MLLPRASAKRSTRGRSSATTEGGALPCSCPPALVHARRRRRRCERASPAPHMARKPAPTAPPRTAAQGCVLGDQRPRSVPINPSPSGKARPARAARARAVLVRVRPGLCDGAAPSFALLVDRGDPLDSFSALFGVVAMPGAAPRLGSGPGRRRTPGWGRAPGRRRAPSRRQAYGRRDGPWHFFMRQLGRGDGAARGKSDRIRRRRSRRNEAAIRVPERLVGHVGRCCRRRWRRRSRSCGGLS